MNYMLARSISTFANVVYWLVFARVMMSWVVRDLSHPAARFLYEITEPILGPCRALLNKFGIGGRIDFSPILALLGIQMIRNILISIVL